jgi:hypothetical protein
MVDRSKIAKKNKATGSKAETTVAKTIAKAFNLKAFDGKIVKEKDAEIGTSRQFSRNMDGRKIDIWIRQDVQPAYLRNLAIQVKKKLVPKGHGPIDTRELEEVQVLGNEVPVLVSHFKHKSPAGRELSGETYVTMKMEDFLKLLKQ